MFRPCIDLHDGKVKQIVGSTLGTSEFKTNFISNKDAAWYANLFKKDGLAGGHIIMLGQGNETEALKALEAYKGGLQIGGGITNINARRYIELGASHVIITSWLFVNGRISFERLNKIHDLVGKQRLVVDLSCRKKENDYYVVTDKWRSFTDTKISEKIICELEEYCDELLIHAADVEGKQTGMDLSLINNLSQWGNIPITYAGGARSIEDLKLTEEAGKGRIHLTIGSALDIFGGTGVLYKDVVEFNNNLKIKKYSSQKQ